MVELDNLKGITIAEAIKLYILKMGLNMEDCSGQGYDEAANMSSPKVGVQKHIHDVAATATCVHCGSHKLNLAIVKSCQIPSVRNMMDVVGDLSRFFLTA